VLQDVLPPGVNFVGFGNTSTQVTTGQSGQILTWSLPPLSPGIYTYQYQVKLDDFLAGGSVLTNNVLLTAPNLPNEAAQVAVTVRAAYTVTIGVYNEVGELVKQIAVTQFSLAVQNAQLSPDGAINSLNDPVAVLFKGVTLGLWDGTGPEGNPVGNGNYYFKIENLDAFGVVTTETQLVNVDRSLAKLQVNVYNEAGEVVRHICDYTDNPTNGEMTSMVLSTNVLPVAEEGTPAPSDQLVVTLSTGVTFVWDGRADNGAPVGGGHYEVEVHWTNGAGVEDVISRGLMVERVGGAENQVVAAPNVLTGGNTTTTLEVLNPTVNLTLKLKVYDVVGELLAEAEGQAAANQVAWDATGKASGLYFAVVELRDPATGRFQGRRILKVLVER
jgi:flagellar hook assembly protein FlgD